MSEAEALWGQETMGGVGQGRMLAGDNRLDAEVGYGLPLGARLQRNELGVCAAERGVARCCGAGSWGGGMGRDAEPARRFGALAIGAQRITVSYDAGATDHKLRDADGNEVETSRSRTSPDGRADDRRHGAGGRYARCVGRRARSTSGCGCWGGPATAPVR